MFNHVYSRQTENDDDSQRKIQVLVPGYRPVQGMPNICHVWEVLCINTLDKHSKQMT